MYIYMCVNAKNILLLNTYVDLRILRQAVPLHSLFGFVQALIRAPAGSSSSFTSLSEAGVKMVSVGEKTTTKIRIISRASVHQHICSTYYMIVLNFFIITCQYRSAIKGLSNVY